MRRNALIEDKKMEISLEADGVEYVHVDQLKAGHSIIAVIERIAQGKVYDPKTLKENIETGERTCEFKTMDCLFFKEKDKQTGEEVHKYLRAVQLLGLVKEEIENGLELNKRVVKLVLVEWRDTNDKQRKYSFWRLFRSKNK